MDIFLSTMDRKQIIKLPVIPSEFRIPSPNQNETYNTISQGDIKLLGPKGLKGISIQSFFPSKDYPFLKDRTYKGWEYQTIIEGWQSKKEPIRLVIVNPKPIVNMLCSIENFEYGIKDGSGDIDYTLALSEFRLLPLRKRNV